MNQTRIGLTAIDPGGSGGIAWINHDGQVQTEKIPETNGDLINILTGLRVAYGARWEVFLEDVPFGIGSGANPSAMAKLHRRAGVVEGVVQALGGRLVMVTPQKWQKFFSLGTKAGSCGGNTTKWKNKLKGEAQRRFPGVDVTLDISDALLILDYGRGAVAVVKEEAGK